MKWKETNYRAELINTQYTLLIDNDQVDIFYDHTHNELQVFIEGECILTTKYHPSRGSWNFINLLDVAAKWYTWHKKKGTQGAQMPTQ